MGPVEVSHREGLSHESGNGSITAVVHWREERAGEAGHCDVSEHTTYVEAFAGGAQVFFHKEPSKVEVLNDLDGEIVNFYRVCQQHYEELLRYFRFALVSREWFDLLKATDPETLTDIQRAARHLYLLKNCYAGLVRNPNYHWHVVQPPGFNLERLPELIENAHKRLARVQIECLPYEEVLDGYDRPTTLFYLDPPYFGSEALPLQLRAGGLREDGGAARQDHGANSSCR